MVNGKLYSASEVKEVVKREEFPGWWIVIDWHGGKSHWVLLLKGQDEVKVILQGHFGLLPPRRGWGDRFHKHIDEQFNLYTVVNKGCAKFWEVTFIEVKS